MVEGRVCQCPSVVRPSLSSPGRWQALADSLWGFPGSGLWCLVWQDPVCVSQCFAAGAPAGGYLSVTLCCPWHFTFTAALNVRCYLRDVSLSSAVCMLTYLEQNHWPDDGSRNLKQGNVNVGFPASSLFDNFSRFPPALGHLPELFATSLPGKVRAGPTLISEESQKWVINSEISLSAVPKHRASSREGFLGLVLKVWCFLLPYKGSKGHGVERSIPLPGDRETSAVLAMCPACCRRLLAHYRLLPIAFPVAFPQFSFCRGPFLAMLQLYRQLLFSWHLLCKNPFYCCGSHNTGFQPEVDKLFVPQ